MTLPTRSSGPSEQALQHALQAWDMGSRFNPRTDVTYAIKATHDPKLGLDRSISLCAIIEYLQQYEGGFYARDIAREFGGDD